MLDTALSTTSIADQLLLLMMIFFARILDVSIGTLRIIFVSKGLKYWSALLGFVEALVWIVAISEVMQNLGDWQTYVAFAGGFAAGNFVGIVLEERIAFGSLIIRIIVRHETSNLVSRLRAAGYAVTCVQGQGETGEVKVVFTLVKRRQLAKIVAVIEEHSPKAFYSIEDVRFASGAVFHSPPQPLISKAKTGLRLRK
jgi:uncharacterized protein YebE (UPF0316 family)